MYQADVREQIGGRVGRKIDVLESCGVTGKEKIQRIKRKKYEFTGKTDTFEGKATVRLI